MTNHIIKSYKFDFNIKEEDNSKTFEGFASTFGNIDSDEDIIVKGAYTKSIKTRNPKMLYQHDTRKVIGIYEDVKETKDGLVVKGRFADTPLGNEVWTLAKMGAIDSMSVGFIPVDVEYDHKTNVRTIKKLDLFEISLVTFPANDQALITSVKSADKITNIRDFERFLRDVGYSLKLAKTIASKGYQAINDEQRDVESDVIEALKSNINQFKK